MTIKPIEPRHHSARPATNIKLSSVGTKRAEKAALVTPQNANPSLQAPPARDHVADVSDEDSDLYDEDDPDFDPDYSRTCKTGTRTLRREQK
jgi:hypothetical protein